MPRNASGTMTLPAGQPVVSGTSISSATHNALAGDIATEITDSLSRSGKGGMTAPLRTADGSVSAPSHSFTNDTDTGVYLAADANPAVTVAGTKRQEWTSTGSAVTGTFSVSGASTLTGVATFAAAPVLNAGASVATGDVTLSQGAAQKVIKSGGTFVVGTSDSNELEFFINNAQVGSFLTSGDFWVGGHKIQAVGTPTLADDATPKTYVDARASLEGKIVAGGFVIGTTGNIANGFGASTSRSSAGVYVVTLSASYPLHTPVAGGAGGVTPGIVAVQQNSATQFTVRTWDIAGSAADRDFTFHVIAGP